MLKQMREGTKSTVLKLTLFGLLLLAMAGLAVTDVQGVFRSGVAGNAVASFGRTKLTAIDFDRLVQDGLREQRIKQSDAYRAGIPMQILKDEINRRLSLLAASDIGLQIGDDLVAKQVKQMLTPLIAKGLTEKEAWPQLLGAYNTSEDGLVGMIRTQIATQQLLGMIVSGAHVPQQLVNSVISYENEWRRGQYFTLTADDLDTIKNPSEKTLQSYYNSIAREYALPEYRTLSVIVLDKNALGDDAKVSNEKVEKYYNENISDYKTPETRVISQVVAADEATAKQIRAEAEKTKDLKSTTKAAGKGSYIKSATVTEAEMPIELSKVAFAAKAGQVLAPIKSPLGWHILSIEKINPETTKSFDSVEAAIEKELSQDNISNALYELSSKIEDELSGGKTLAEVAKENHLQIVRLEKVDAHGIERNGKKSDAPLQLFDKVIDNGFALRKGASSQLIETSDSSFMIVSTDDIFPSEQQNFNKVQALVLKRWKINEQTKALADKSAKIMERLKKGASFEKIAGEFNKPVQSTPLIKRGTAAATLQLDDHLVTALFSIDKTGHTTTVSGNNSVTLVRLSERQLKPLKEMIKGDITASTALINSTFRQDLLEQYRLSLMDKYSVSINDKLMAEMYRPKDSADPGGDE